MKNHYIAQISTLSVMFVSNHLSDLITNPPILSFNLFILPQISSSLPLEKDMNKTIDIYGEFNGVH